MSATILPEYPDEWALAVTQSGVGAPALRLAWVLFLYMGKRKGKPNFMQCFVGQQTLGELSHTGGNFHRTMSELMEAGLVARSACRRCKRADCLGGNGHVKGWQATLPPCEHGNYHSLCWQCRVG